MTYDITATQTVILTFILLWELVWKGMALWRAAHRDQPKWFVVLLVVNSAGLLPIFYLLTHESTTSPKTAGSKNESYPLPADDYRKRGAI